MRQGFKDLKETGEGCRSAVGFGALRLACPSAEAVSETRKGISTGSIRLCLLAVMFSVVLVFPDASRAQTLAFEFTDPVDLDALQPGTELELYQWYRKRSLKDGEVFISHVIYFDMDSVGAQLADCLVREILIRNGLDPARPVKDESSPILRSVSGLSGHVSEIGDGSLTVYKVWKRTTGTAPDPVKQGYVVLDLRRRFLVMVVSQ